MRLDEIKSLQERERYEDLSEDELLFALEMVERQKLTSKELHKLVDQEKDNFTRDGKSLYHAALRMYLIVHGTLPEGTKPNRMWHEVSEKMAEVAMQHGHDINDNVSIVRARARKQAKQIMPFDTAMDYVMDYARGHKHLLDVNLFGRMKKSIAQKIQSGEHIDLAFEPVMNVESVFTDLENRLFECRSATMLLTENTNTFFELGDLLNAALIKYNAAKRGLGIANKLRNPGERAKHKSIIMGHLNRLRADVSRMEKLLNG